MYRRLLAMTALLVLLPTTVRAEWLVARGDALMSGVGNAKLPDTLEQLWTFKTGDAIEGAPIIAGGTVYVASLDKHLYAIDLATGKQKWKVKLSHMKAFAGRER